LSCRHAETAEFYWSFPARETSAFSAVKNSFLHQVFKRKTREAFSPDVWGNRETAMQTKPVPKKPRPKTPEVDLSPYAGRWVALVGGRVAGVGLTPGEARIAAKLARPKEEPVIRFVPVGRQWMRKETDRKH
jgi:hypothetical protein